MREDRESSPSERSETFPAVPRRIPLWLPASQLPGIGLLAAGMPLPALGAFFISHMALLWGTLVPGSRMFGPVMTRLDRASARQRRVWLTFDDGPDPRTTPALLDLLDAEDCSAGFFFIGDRAVRRPDLVQETIRRGHLVGNHTQSHPAYSFWRLGPAAIEREIRGAQDTLAEISGSVPTWFRSPVGMHNPFVDPVLRQLQLKLAGWSARGFDGSRTDLDRISRRIQSHLAPGAIAVIHEARPTTHELARRVLDAIRQRNLTPCLPAAPGMPDPML